MNWLSLFADITRDHVDLSRVDVTRTRPAEVFACRDCYFVGMLTTTGRCARCGSESVHHSEVLEAR
jgi:uncharacterized paraquat-inducible protein A